MSSNKVVRLRFDEALLLLLLHRRRRARKHKRKRNREIWVQLILQYKHEGDFYTLLPKIRSQEKCFYKYFRMSRRSFEELTDILKNKICRQDTIMRKSISAEERIAITLR